MTEILAEIAKATNHFNAHNADKGYNFNEWLIGWLEGAFQDMPTAEIETIIYTGIAPDVLEDMADYASGNWSG